MNEALGRLRKGVQHTEWSGKLWLVGGIVRDEILGRTLPSDADILVEGDAIALGRFLWQQGVSEIAPVEYERFGTVLIHVAGEKVELVTARKESYDRGSRKPHVQQASLEEDALRRDFTVNTLLRNLETGDILDPLGVGMADLRAGVLRTPCDPATTFSDDPLRMLRAVRFRWKLGFAPAPGLYEAIREESERLRIISQERIRDELSLMLLGPNPTQALDDLRELGLLQIFAPELAVMHGVEQNRWHYADVWTHTMKVVEGVRGDLCLRLAALLHDVGKPPTRALDESGEARFFGHERVGAEIARKWLRDMRFPGEIADSVVLLVRHHMRLGFLRNPTQAALRRVTRDLHGHHEELFELVKADAAALKAGVKTNDFDTLIERIRAIDEEPLSKTSIQGPLTGEEIMGITGLHAGPEIGKIKAMLAERILDGRLAPEDHEAAVKAVQEWR